MTWQDYEKEVYNALCDIYPNCEIEFNDWIFGIFSLAERQIDFAIRGEIAGETILGIVDCKYYDKNVDVKAIESFMGMAQDVNANFGILITKKGYSLSAKNRVKYSNLKLEILTPNELNVIDISVDYFVNKSIKGLKLSKYEFFKRWSRNSAYFDPEKSNYQQRSLVFKEGFANTEYYAQKKTLESCIRAFRDFDRLDNIKTTIPANLYNNKTGLDDKKTEFTCTITRTEIEHFLILNINELRDDVSIWRKSFLGNLTKELVSDFANSYIKTKSIK
ncbi:MAG: restriction endonuclease [bacterium]|nr:restriction endonuclease [bacterium]